MGQLANKIFLWLDAHRLCPCAIVMRLFPNDGPDWVYDLGFSACTWIVMRLPEDNL